VTSMSLNFMLQFHHKIRKRNICRPVC